MNKLYEVGGVADILIKVKSERTIGGKTYVANEPYTMLKDVQVVLNYEQITSNVAAKTPISASQSARPTQVVVGNISLTQKVLDLIALAEEDHNQIRTRQVIAIADSNTLYLPSKPANSDIFIYDKENNRIPFNDIIDDTIGGAFNDGESYLVFYYEKIDVDIYNFEIPHFAYFDIEIYTKGNTNKIGSNLYMHFPAVSLVTAPNFNITYNNILDTPLVFEVIYRGQPEPIFAFGV